LGALLDWSKEAKEVIKQLTAGVNEINEKLVERVQIEGQYEHDGQQWTEAPAYATNVDKQRLHEVLGDRFYRVIGVTKYKVEDETRSDPEMRVRAMSCWEKLENGTTIKQKKVTDGD
jgi:hypothetical protein